MTYTLTEVRGPVGIVVLNNPARRNALSKPLVDEIMAALADFARRKLREPVFRYDKADDPNGVLSYRLFHGDQPVATLSRTRARS